MKMYARHLPDRIKDAVKRSKDWKAGQEVQVPVLALRWTHDTIDGSLCFRNQHSIFKPLDQLQRGEIGPDDFYKDQKVLFTEEEMSENRKKKGLRQTCGPGSLGPCSEFSAWPAPANWGTR